MAVQIMWWQSWGIAAPVEQYDTTARFGRRGAHSADHNDIDPDSDVLESRVDQGAHDRQGRPIRLLVADDHNVFRNGLASLLDDEPDIEVVGQARDGQGAIDLSQELKPDIILMDVTMPRVNGVEATRRIVEQRPESIVIGLSMHDSESLAKSMAEAGARDYIEKGCPLDELLETIRRHAPRA